MSKEYFSLFQINKCDTWRVDGHLTVSGLVTNFSHFWIDFNRFRTNFKVDFEGFILKFNFLVVEIIVISKRTRIQAFISKKHPKFSLKFNQICRSQLPYSSELFQKLIEGNSFNCQKRINQILKLKAVPRL